MAAARDAGVAVSNTPGVLTEATADLTMTLLLMAARRAGEGERELRAGDWSGWRPTHLLGTQVSGKTLGLIGMGRIARAVAQRAPWGFGMRIVCHNRSPVEVELSRPPVVHATRSTAGEGAVPSTMMTGVDTADASPAA